MNVDRSADELGEQLNALITEGWLTTAPLCDMFVVLNALHAYDAARVTGDVIALAVRRLVAAEQAPGGPYAEAQAQPDFDTNAAILHFVSWVAGDLPNTAHFLATELAVKKRARRTISHLAYMQLRTLPAFRAVLPSVPPQPTKRTRRVVAEALALQSIATEHRAAMPDRYATLSTAIYEHAQSMFDPFDKGIAAQASHVLDKIQRADRHHEIALLAAYYNEALLDGITSKTVCHKLGVANVLCWMAYTLYDDILDGDATASLLPLANIAHRQSVVLYESACPDAQLQSFVRSVFDEMDAANDWELQATRVPLDTIEAISTAELPDYGDLHILARRAFGHVLGPIILSHHVDLEPEQRQLIRHSLTQYLIARQLNDDAHDWLEDLQAGHLSPVVVALLKKALGKKHSTKTLTAHMQHVFWQEVGNDILRIITGTIDDARRQLIRTGAFTSNNRLLDIYDTTRVAAQQSHIVHQDAQKFLQQFAGY